jgi:hypothetical protein
MLIGDRLVASDAAAHHKMVAAISSFGAGDGDSSELRLYSALAQSPNLSPKAKAWAHNMARSATVSVALGEKALAYHAPHPNPEVEKRFKLYCAFHQLLPVG